MACSPFVVSVQSFRCILSVLLLYPSPSVVSLQSFRCILAVLPLCQQFNALSFFGSSPLLLADGGRSEFDFILCIFYFLPTFDSCGWQRSGNVAKNSELESFLFCVIYYIEPTRSFSTKFRNVQLQATPHSRKLSNLSELSKRDGECSSTSAPTASSLRNFLSCR